MPDAAPMAADARLAPLRAALDDRGWIDAAEAMAPYLAEERGLYTAKAAAIARPADTAEVAALVRAAAEAGVVLVPQGGNTSLVGGSIPLPLAGPQAAHAYGNRPVVVVSLQRMDRIRAIDPLDYSITVEAGCILQSVQDAAADVDRLFPLSLAAEGTCRIGGNLSTNAGGTMTVRYGNARDLVLGLEVVLADGRVWHGLKALRKDNTGYDLKHLFLGAEGTLGIITAATLKLFPRPRQVHTAFAAVPSPNAALALLARMRTESGDAITAFELMPRFGLDITLTHIDGTNDPLADPSPWYVLMDLATGTERLDLRGVVEEALAAAYEAGEVTDATLAESDAQRAALWKLREGIVQAQKYEGGSIKHDVSVPVSAVPRFLGEASERVGQLIPGVRVCAFGHVGDGNIHFNISQPVGADRDGFLARWEEVNRAVHDVAVGLGGSFSAEHGVGRMKRGEMARFKSAVELDLQRAVKQALDPANCLNPGMVLPD